MALKTLSRRNSPTVRPLQASQVEANISCKQNTIEQLSTIRAHVKNILITLKAILERVRLVEGQLAVRKLQQTDSIELQNKERQLQTIRPLVKSNIITTKAILRQVRLVEELLAMRRLQQTATIELQNSKQQVPIIVVDCAENSNVSEDGRPGQAARTSSVGVQ
jgi:hypothetical protein